MTTQISAQMCFKMAAKRQDFWKDFGYVPYFIFSLCYSPEKRRHVFSTSSLKSAAVSPAVGQCSVCMHLCVCVCVSTATHTEPSARIHAADRIRSVAMVASRSSLGVKALPVAFRGLLSFLSLLLSSLMFTLLVHSASSQSRTRCSSSKWYCLSMLLFIYLFILHLWRSFR